MSIIRSQHPIRHRLRQAAVASAAVAVGLAFGGADPAAAGVDDEIQQPDQCVPYDAALITASVEVDGSTATYTATWLGQLPPCEFVTVWAGVRDNELDQFVPGVPALPKVMFDQPGVPVQVSRELPCQYTAYVWAEVDGHDQPRIVETSGDRCAPSADEDDGDQGSGVGLPQTGGGSPALALVASALVGLGLAVRRTARAS